MLLGRIKANRYKVGKDADDLGAVSVSTQPAMCLVFSKDYLATKSGSKKKKGEARAVETEKEKWVGIIRAVGLQVSVTTSTDDVHYFLLVSAPEAVLRYQAEQMELKLRCKKIYGGGLYKFQRRLLDLYDKSSEGDLFASLHQLQIVDAILQAKRQEGGAQMDYTWMINSSESSLTQAFYMHHESTRKQLNVGWARFAAWKLAQPMELIREYFGEKVALYFCWLGFYTQMLWVPALVGAVVMGSQVYTQFFTGSLDNPWVPMYCVFTACWAIFYLEGWKRLENQKKFEWDTENFEEQEADRPSFKMTDVRTDPVTREEQKYYPTYKRRGYMCLTSLVVMAFMGLVVLVVCQIMVLQAQISRMSGGLGMLVGGVLNAASIMTLNWAFDQVVEPLTDMENWQTETQYEDAKIAKDFCFKFVNCYFALFFVAFIQNYVVVFGEDLHCPNYECMPVLTVTLALVFSTQMVIQQAYEISAPMVEAWRKRREVEEKIAKEGKSPPPQSPEEVQSHLQPYVGVFDDYNEIVAQFGYVSLFAAAFPLTATLALLNNIVEIRVDALKVLMSSQRPKYLCAADIGTWMTILEILATVAIVTNVALVGFTSHGLYFYLPDMDILDRVWAVVIAEHALLFVKIVGQAVIDDVTAEAVEDHEVTQYKLKEAIAAIKKSVDDMDEDEARAAEGDDAEEDD